MSCWVKNSSKSVSMEIQRVVKDALGLDLAVAERYLYHPIMVFVLPIAASGFAWPAHVPNTKLTPTTILAF